MSNPLESETTAYEIHKNLYGLIILTTLTHLTNALFTSPVRALIVFTPSLITLLILIQQFNIIQLSQY